MDKRLLTIQDISCVGQCSLTVALPVISACGIETAVLPSSVLSNHTAFKSWTFNDLTFDMENILNKWKNEGITFSAFYTGYVSEAQIPVIKKIIKETSRKDALVVVDPVMADNGKMYPGFAQDFPKKMKELCSGADVVLPNITEASFLLGIEYRPENYGKDYIENICAGLLKLGAKNAVLTGVSFEKENSVSQSATENLLNIILQKNFRFKCTEQAMFSPRPLLVQSAAENHCLNPQKSRQTTLLSQ